MGRPLIADFVAYINGYGITSRQQELLAAKLRRIETGCLVFSGRPSKAGYGTMKIGNDHKGKTEYAHRVAWVLSGHELVPGMDLMHQCPGGDNPLCCNVDHLELGTPIEHARDKKLKMQTSKSLVGLPFGVCVYESRRKGTRYAATVKVNGKQCYFGVYGSWQEASAAALLHRNLTMYPDVSAG